VKETWQSAPERGSVIGIRFVVALCRLFGRRAASAFIYVLSVYYAFFDLKARRASRAYLRRAALPTTFGSVVTHFWYFGCVALDRHLFLAGRTASFEINEHGRGRFDALRRLGDGRGALVLGSHVGSFEALRALAISDGVPLSIVVDFRNARRISRVLAELAPDARVNVIGLDPARATSMLEVKACIDHGGVVGLLADRVTESVGRAVDVTFLGETAAFPSGPYRLAHLLGCPVYVFAALFSPPNRYDIHFQPFAEAISLPAESRDEASQGYAQKYASWLESCVELAPYNWFNFFEFWGTPSPARSPKKS
jgi:predicted LPLAT superfamily acyltransferase